MTRYRESIRPVIHWFRKDLRLTDNPALSSAAESGHPVLPVYIFESGDSDPWAPGGASKWWLHHSLKALDQSLETLGNRLILRRGRPQEVLLELVTETGATAVYCNSLTEPHVIKVDSELERILNKLGTGFRALDGILLFPPESITTKNGKPYKVFTPFYKACLKKLPLPNPLPTLRRLPRVKQPIRSDSLKEWKLLPTKSDWSSGWLDMWTPGESGALARLDSFLEQQVAGYGTLRNRPDILGTSKLSPHFHFGEISPLLCCHRALSHVNPEAENDFKSFFRQIVWREFSHHLLYHCPKFPEKPFQAEFKRFAWVRDEEALRRWQSGLTGYPIVDAGMRELWATGWMHNRVRMIVASFLVKHLLIPWQDGAKWFWDTLVDADLANNSVSWQWVAGCGVDAAPFFRIFNPILQGQKFDPDGTYVRRWVPELANLQNKHIHEPWAAPKKILENSGVSLGNSYPYPIVDHLAARNRALEVFRQIRN
ncbi:MAG: deoxyribodipyrimidine photo-lyase [Candidatus Dadabacteria bacterium]|nr:deoxyribodipyrimidine photo-lyase [Candidatus Dadabacteria bacterium]MYA48969.1 deoxyribodipyrimidine photo-lyase [Candidatus Dadabacteria bacterium]MYF47465.1 deoxyribodipyrimidine photo-lyase [Candidatus Dadabacteria bacterium]MYG83488.1 deoxyribodipyrimidine photo-lyase [Candidatus Dadabacteria bacterium]MYK48764.1 deoxyribodipyrimidine photo-lyase [Candidatus Dadabacteria bacterium]